MHSFFLTSRQPGSGSHACSTSGCLGRLTTGASKTPQCAHGRSPFGAASSRKSTSLGSSDTSSSGRCTSRAARPLSHRSVAGRSTTSAPYAVQRCSTIAALWLSATCGQPETGREAGLRLVSPPACRPSQTSRRPQAAASSATRAHVDLEIEDTQSLPHTAAPWAGLVLVEGEMWPWGRTGAHSG